MIFIFDLNEVVGVYDFITKLFYCCRQSFEYLNLPKFHFVKLRKLSDLCSKIYEKSLSATKKGIFKTIKFKCCQIVANVLCNIHYYFSYINLAI